MTVDPATEAAGEADEVSAESDLVVGDTGVQPIVWGRPDWIAIGALFLVTFVLVGLHVRAYPTLSPIDELQHIDYVIKAGNFEPPHVNDLVGFEAMSEAACRSVDAPGYIGPLCGLDEYDPEDFQENGVNTSAGQFPFYYTVTGVLSRITVAAGVVGSPVTAARMVGALWAGAAWSVIWYILALLRIPRMRRVVALAALIATAFTLFHSATVNADGVLMFTGALAVLATLKFETGRLNGWLLLASYAALYFVEPTNILAIAPSALYLGVMVSRRSDASTLRRVLPLLAIPMVVLFRLSIAKSVHRFLFPASPRTNRPTMLADNAAPDGVVWDKVLAQLDTLFTPVNYAFVPDFLVSQRTDAMQEVVNWLLIGAMFSVAVGAIAMRSAAGRSTVVRNEVDSDDLSDETEIDELAVADERLAWLTRFGIVALIAAGPFYTFSFAYFSNADFPAQARFALPLVVFLVVGLAAALTTRWAMAIASTLVALASANLLWLLLTP